MLYPIPNVGLARDRAVPASARFRTALARVAGVTLLRFSMMGFRPAIPKVVAVAERHKQSLDEILEGS